ncbi:lysozyme [Dankookia sp. P2]|uniref:lysozyme n=1 Tax=Dankookia sp. P2 TaxID=3423955 RepID=UPI003D66DFF1
MVAKKPCAAAFAELQAYGQPMSRTTGSLLLEADTRIARAAVNNLLQAPLDDAQFGALVSFTFNVGIGAFSRSRLLRLVNNGEFEGAEREFMRWVKSNGRVLDGLVTRRSCESAMFRGDVNISSPRFRRQDCGQLGAAPDAEELLDIRTGRP